MDSTPPGLSTWVARVRAEYREMPGLRLTVAHAQRLWRLDGSTCGAVLRALVKTVRRQNPSGVLGPPDW